MDDKMYLENLEEEVVQMDNVVTYKWLVRTLKVTANVAKRMLFEFVEKQKSAGVHLNVSYLVAGEKTVKGQDVPVHEISIVPSSQLEAAEARFETVTSRHIYAVHKAEIKDFHSVLYAVDYNPAHDRVSQTKIGCAIKSPSVALRSECGTEALKLPESPRYVSRNEKVAAVKKPEPMKEVKPAAKPASVMNNGKKTAKSKGRNQGGNLVGMFESMGKKKKEIKIEKDTSVVVDKTDDKLDDKHEVCEDTATAMRGGPAKAAEKPTQNRKKDVKTEKTRVVEVKKEVREKRKAKTETTAKKRRRIIQISDSSSEEESEPEDPIPTPPESSDEEPVKEVEEVAEVPVKTGGSGRRSIHKRKLVKESGMDEDGFLVTQNNWEDASGSEDSVNENEDPIPKAKLDKPSKMEEPVEPKKVTPKSKQASLTSFFKKK